MSNIFNTKLNLTKLCKWWNFAFRKLRPWKKLHFFEANTIKFQVEWGQESQYHLQGYVTKGTLVVNITQTDANYLQKKMKITQ